MHLHDVYIANLNMVHISGSYFKPAPDRIWTSKNFSFTFNKFYYITKGRCLLTIDGAEYTAVKGDWFFIPAGTVHSYANFPGEPFEKHWIHFDISPDTSFVSLLKLPHFVRLSPGTKAHNLFKQYARISGSRELMDKLTVKSLLFSLLAEYIRLSNPGKVPLLGSRDARIDDILSYIHAHIAEPLSIPDLADSFHMHPNHFIRFFKDKTGQTPAKYIKIMKMELAKRYLEETDLYISEIMEKIGETDACSFSKQFKSIHMLSPREYRNYFRNI